MRIDWNVVLQAALVALIFSLTVGWLLPWWVNLGCCLAMGWFADDVFAWLDSRSRVNERIEP